MKNYILTDFKQGLHDYEKLREENPKIRKAETLVNYSLVPISGILSTLIYHHFISGIPIHKPTEEEIMDVMINGARYGWVSPAGGYGGSIIKEVETREEAIKYLIDRQKYDRAFGYTMCSVGVPLGLIVLLFGINPGEKILKYPHALGKSFLNSGRKLKSYLKGMQKLKKERKEMYQNESKSRGCSVTRQHKALSECERLQNLNGALIPDDKKKPLVLGSNPNNPIAHGGELK